MVSFKEKDKDSAYYRIVSRDWTADELLRRQRLAGSPVWAEGDELTFFYEGNATKIELMGGIQLPLRQVKDTNLWTLTVWVKDLGKAIIGYGFIVDCNDSDTSTSVQINQWRGPEAPVPPEKAEPLEGQLIEQELDSLWLDKDVRKLSVYLPPNYTTEDNAKVIYMADGQSVTSYAQYLEPLFFKNALPSIVLIGIHSASYDPLTKIDQRAQEYLPGYSDEIFEAHTNFFVQRVLPWAEDTFKVSSCQDDRGVFGASNGAAFAIAMGRRYADLFGNIIAFSLGWPKELELNWKDNLVPRHYLAAGVLEDGFRDVTAKWADILKKSKADYFHGQYIGGHDHTVWREEFARALIWTFGNSASAFLS